MSDTLVFRAGEYAGKEFKISAEEISIGRDQENTIVLNDVQISRRHARIFSDKSGLFIEDLKSTNGSLLNGKKIKKAQKLKNGDVITLGEQNIFEIQLTSNNETADSVEKKLNEPDSSPIEEIEAVDPLVENADKVEMVQRSEEQPEENRAGLIGKLPTWAIILMIAIAFLIVFCLIPLVVIEVTNQWCNLFSGFFNAISPGVCP